MKEQERRESLLIDQYLMLPNGKLFFADGNNHRDGKIYLRRKDFPDVGVEIDYVSRDQTALNETYRIVYEILDDISTMLDVQCPYFVDHAMPVEDLVSMTYWKDMFWELDRNVLMMDVSKLNTDCLFEGTDKKVRFAALIAHEMKHIHQIKTEEFSLDYAAFGEAVWSDEKEIDADAYAYAYLKSRFGMQFKRAVWYINPDYDKKDAVHKYYLEQRLRRAKELISNGLA